jgi:type IV secretory pathway TraG/TraD family ATPase VirD4
MSFFRRNPVTPKRQYQGLYLGRPVGEGMGAEPLRYKLANLSSLIVGPPGSAKTAGLIIPNVAHLRQSMIIMCVKGQITAVTRRLRETMGRVIVVNHLNYKSDELPQLKGEKWSPSAQMADPASTDFTGDADCIGESILTKGGGQDSGNARFFDIGAENIISLFVQHDRVVNGKKAHLRNVRTMLSEPSIYDKTTKEPVGGFAYTLKQMTMSDVYAVRTTANRILTRLMDGNSHGTSLQDVIDTALKDFRFLNSDVAAFNMSSGSIDFGAMHREITTIFLVIPIHELDPTGFGKFLRIFLNLALRNLYRNPPTKDATLPRVLLVLDEFAQLGRLQEIPKALGASRDYFISCLFVLQSLGQLKTLYPEWELFFTGSGTKTLFRAGDLETAEHFSKIFGSGEKDVTTQNQNGGWSQTPQAIPLIRPEDLMRLPRQVTVNMIDDCPYPILAHVPIYTKTPWNEGLDPNPYYRG